MGGGVKVFIGTRCRYETPTTALHGSSDSPWASVTLEPE